MLQFVCHPALQNLLTISREDAKCVTLPNNAVLISDYLPKTPPSIHAGLIEAVKFRLLHSTHFIFIASFFAKEKLLPYDTFGILSLSGTEFIRLPLQADKLLLLIEEKQNAELNLSKPAWEGFAIKACKALLKEKLSMLKHGDKLDFVNKVSFALRIEAQNCLKDPQRMVELKKLLVLVKSYNQKAEIIELIELSNVCESLSDSYLDSVIEFVNGLKQLEFLETQQQIDFHLLISDIDKLNTVFSKILNP